MIKIWSCQYYKKERKKERKKEQFNPQFVKWLIIILILKKYFQVS